MGRPMGGTMDFGGEGRFFEGKYGLEKLIE